MARNVVKEIRKATRRKFSAEEKIRIVLEGLRGEIPVSDICRREGIAPTLYYRWSKAFLDSGKNGLTRDTQRDASSEEVRRGNQHRFSTLLEPRFDSCFRFGCGPQSFLHGM